MTTDYSRNTYTFSKWTRYIIGLLFYHNDSHFGEGGLLRFLA